MASDFNFFKKGFFDMANDTLDTTEGDTIPPSDTNSPIESINQEPKTDWLGDTDFFQTGKKAGQLKPRAAGRGKPATELGGLDIESLRATPSQQAAPPPVQDKASVKAERKLVEAKVASKMVMRLLDMVTNWVSKGQYGADFTDQQRKARNKYRDELETDWQDYLITLDIPMHPALVAIFGSLVYVQDAFNTPAGIERTKTLKEKMIGAVISKFVRG